MRIHFVLLGVLFVADIIAGPVDLSYDDRNKDFGMGHRYSVPTVSTDGDEITIKSDSTIFNVDIIIRDQFGNVMHRSTQNIGPMETTISVPDYGDGTEKMKIDIYYDEKHLSGYFE